MGTCCIGKSKFLDHAEYTQICALQVIEKDSRGKVTAKIPITFGLLKPIDQVFNLVNILNNKIRTSGCVIPGLDPRGECDKECQDSLAFVSHSQNFLSILFDGHGKDGKRVSWYCRDFMLNYFHKNHENFQQDPQAAIEEMVETCENELVNSGIECNLSGTTAVILLINSSGLHVASLGDSRAILASVPKQSKANEKKQFFSGSQYKRPIRPIRDLDIIPLTIDQKPNHEDELKRILNSGGIVEKLSDDKGKPIGPYRVWKKKGNLPGLAMSRSIGDQIAHEIGVISVPIFHKFKLFPPFDQFIVIASDGVWDVMENQEVVNFVDKFRNSCTTHGNEYPATVNNSTVARLLCEEARFRWFGIVEEEDVMIDDISCVVIELCFEPVKAFESATFEDRFINKFKSIAIENNSKSATANAVRKDPTRGSMTSDQEAIEKLLQELQNE